MGDTAVLLVMGKSRRITREEKTIRAMLEIYCSHFHGGSSSLCASCNELYTYAEKRLAKCLYGSGKPQCNKCPVHCYKPSMREKVKEVMKFSGPRMLKKHPILAVLHIIDGFRHKHPVKQARQS